MIPLFGRVYVSWMVNHLGTSIFWHISLCRSIVLQPHPVLSLGGHWRNHTRRGLFGQVLQNTPCRSKGSWKPQNLLVLRFYEGITYKNFEELSHCPIPIPFPTFCTKKIDHLDKSQESEAEQIFREAYEAEAETLRSRSTSQSQMYCDSNGSHDIGYPWVSNCYSSLICEQ